MKWFVLIQGGEGPDVWEKELEVEAVDFSDASNQASAKAEYFGGHVVSLECFYSRECPRCEQLQRDLDELRRGWSRIKDIATPPAKRKR